MFFNFKWILLNPFCCLSAHLPPSQGAGHMRLLYGVGLALSVPWAHGFLRPCGPPRFLNIAVPKVRPWLTTPCELARVFNSLECVLPTRQNAQVRPRKP